MEHNKNRPIFVAGLNKQGLPHVDGPVKGCGFNAHLLHPELTFEKIEDAERAAIIANKAYKRGYRQALYDQENNKK